MPVLRRFHASVQRLPMVLVRRLVRVDHDAREAIVAEIGGEVVGVARYDRSPADPDEAEFAVVVEDDWQNVGLGRQLLTELTRLATCRGVRVLTATVQADNERMVWLIRRLLPAATFTPTRASTPCVARSRAGRTSCPAEPAGWALACRHERARPHDQPAGPPRGLGRMTVAVGTMLPDLTGDSVADRRAMVGDLAAAGVDHLAIGDHVSFFGGQGFDGLVQAGHLLALSDALPVHVGVYLLALRHPVPVARQLSDLGALAPGRLVLGVGIGGEDRHEYEACGVDPATRGARTDEALALLRRLATGEPVSSEGPCFPVRDAQIRPAWNVPIVVGGRSAAAVRRAARHGDGWLGIWVSARRFAEVTAQVAELAAAEGRDVAWRHGLQVWCGFGATAQRASAPLAQAMEQLYATPFAAFERYCPAGTPEDVAAFLRPYVDAGCRSFNLIPRAADRDEALAGVAEVRRLLQKEAVNRTLTQARRQLSVDA